MDAIVSLWLHESLELRVGTAATEAVVVQDVAAKGVVVHDTAHASASAWKTMAVKDIQDLRRRKEDSNNDAGNYNHDASEEGREDSNDQSDSSDDSFDQSEDESSATDDDDEEVAATSHAMDAAAGFILSKTQRGSTIMYKIGHGIVDASYCDSKTTQEFLDTAHDCWTASDQNANCGASSDLDWSEAESSAGTTEFEGDYWIASTEALQGCGINVRREPCTSSFILGSVQNGMGKEPLDLSWR
jgi:hypothetical protein